MLVKSGEKITCENGHTICEAAHSLYKGTIVSVDNFTNFKHNQIPPVLGDRIDGHTSKCNSCGSPWIRAIGYMKIHIHTKDGWQ